MYDIIFGLMYNFGLFQMPDSLISLISWFIVFMFSIEVFLFVFDGIMFSLRSIVRKIR